MRFIMGPVLATNTLPSPPRFTPPRTLGFGDYCFRAVCFMVDPNDEVTGKISGFDRSVDIADEVGNACKLHTRGRHGMRCLPPELTLLPSSPRECSGQVYFDFDVAAGKLKK